MLKMTISRYEIVNAVVKYNSFSKASVALNITQPGISHAIRSLEDEWGFPILIRGHSGVNVTNEGKKIIKTIQELLQINEKITQEVAEINGLQIGEVRIGAFASITSHFLPKVIQIFKESYPSIKIDINQGVYEEIEQWILDGKVDCGFLALPINNKSLNVTPIKRDKLLCIVSDKHPLCKDNKIKFSQIEKEPFI